MRKLLLLTLVVLVICTLGFAQPATTLLRHEDRTVAQGSLASWSGGLPTTNAATLFFDSSWGRGAVNMGTTVTNLSFYTSVLNIPTGYTGSMPVVVKFYSADTTHTATMQLQYACTAPGTAVATLASSWASLGSPITLTPASTASEIVSTSNTETVSCSAGNDFYVNVTLTVNTLTSPLYFTFVGLYPTASLTTP